MSIKEKRIQLLQGVADQFTVKIGKLDPLSVVCKNNRVEHHGKAIDRYAAACKPGEYVRLQARFLK